ncbi:hypothetical protein DPMN_055223 [Dreissena polymorpha]|uniref:Uncharacterized protein n=1 Tax=Dreissena polymorpha TaxID=45954 RepID=A0A9D4CQZ9_DREPO|nr:hypothetical protein DPMN_055223 [Dreissena polymorpha]
MSKHKDQVLVQEALSHPEGSKERDNAFDRIRKDGIYLFNKEQSGTSVLIGKKRAC